MKIGVCEKDLPGTLDENLRFLSLNGFEGFQVWPDRVKDAKLLAEKCADSVLEISAVGGGPNLVDPGMEDEALAGFRGRFDMACELGCRVVTAETKSKPPGMVDKDAWEHCVKIVKKVCSYASDAGCFFAVEPSGECFLKDAEMWLYLYEKVDSDSLKVNYDPANIVWAGKDPAAGARLLGNYMVHTHAKDIIRLSSDGAPDGISCADDIEDVPAGYGLVDYKSYINALMETGYDGFLTIEMHREKKLDRREDILESKLEIEKFLGRA